MIFFKRYRLNERIESTNRRIETLNKKIDALRSLLHDKGVLCFHETTRWSCHVTDDNVDLFKLRNKLDAVYEYLNLEEVVEPSKKYLRKKKGAK